MMSNVMTTTTMTMTVTMLLGEAEDAVAATDSDDDDDDDGCDDDEGGYDAQRILGIPLLYDNASDDGNNQNVQDVVTTMA